MRSRGDRIRTCGILLPKQPGSFVVHWAYPVGDSVLPAFLRHQVSASISRSLTVFARLSHNWHSNMPLLNCHAFPRQKPGSSPLGVRSQRPAVRVGTSATIAVESVWRSVMLGPFHFRSSGLRVDQRLPCPAFNRSSSVGTVDRSPLPLQHKTLTPAAPIRSWISAS